MLWCDERLPQRFWDKVQANPVTGCWEWFGRRCADGYGRWGSGRPHRIVYRELVGPTIKGYHIDHLCRVRHCCAPHHLEQVLPETNIRRGDTGKYNSNKTHCLEGHPYLGKNLYVHKGRRHCRICRAATQRRYSARRL